MDGARNRQGPSSTRNSVFSLAEFAELVSAALDINSSRFPDGVLALAFSPDTSSPRPFYSDQEFHQACLRRSFVPSSSSGASSAHRQRYQRQNCCLLHQGMHPPLDSIDFGRVNCVPGLGCAQHCNSGQLKASSVPIITVTTAASPSRPRQVLQKIRQGATAFVARTRTLSTPAKHVPSLTQARPSARKSPTSPTQVFLNPDNQNHEPIPTVSISASYKNNIQLRSAVSLLDLESLNNNSAYSLATNTADFYDDESDFVPYLPLACQYERAVPKSPSMPSLMPGLQKSTPTATVVTFVAPPKDNPRTGIGTNAGAEAPAPHSRPTSGNSTTRSRCASTSHVQQRGSRPDGRNRALSASSVNSSTTDTASPVTPRSSAWLAGGRPVRTDKDQVRRPLSAFSLDSTCDSDAMGEPNSLGLKGIAELGLDDSDDPFAKGSVQIVRTKSRVRPAFQLYNPDFVIGPGIATSDGAVGFVSSQSKRNATGRSSDNTQRRHPNNAAAGTSSPSSSASRAVHHKSRSPHPRSHGKKSPRPSVSPTPISRMKKTPVVFPLMPGETEADRKQQHDDDIVDRDEWTLCLGTSDMPGSRRPESEQERKDMEVATEPQDTEQEDKKSVKPTKLKISDSEPTHDRGRSRSARKMSVPQLRVTHFVEGGAEETSKAVFSGDDWTLMLPLYNIPPDPLLAKSERGARRASHSPSIITLTQRHDAAQVERRRAVSCTSATPTITDLRGSSRHLSKLAVKARSSIDEITLRDSSARERPRSSSLSPATIESPDQKVTADRLTLPATSCSNLSVVSAGSRASYGSNGSAESRESMVSVASLASRTTSSTVTVVPGPWQREQMQQRQEHGPQVHDSQSLMAEPHTDGPVDRQRRASVFSVTTTVRSTTEFVIAETPGGGVRKTTVVNRMPLPVGREAEIRARTVSTGGFRTGAVRCVGTRVDPSPSWTMAGVTSLFSALSKEPEKGKAGPLGKEPKQGGEPKKRKASVREKKNPMRMPGQWLDVSEDSTGSACDQDSTVLRQGRPPRTKKRGSVASSRSEGLEGKVLDDNASSYSGAYYSARSSFSLSAA